MRFVTLCGCSFVALLLDRQYGKVDWSAMIVQLGDSMNWLWIVLAVAGLFVAWWVLKIVTSLAVPAEVSGRALLKLELKRVGVDVSRIPDRAIDEIVQHCIKAAKGIALASHYSSHGSAGGKNWRANLVRQLQVQVPMIRSAITGERTGGAESHVREILARNGVLK